MTQNIGEDHFMDNTDKDINFFWQVAKEKLINYK
jgi:hypothetical protein